MASRIQYKVDLTVDRESCGRLYVINLASPFPLVSYPASSTGVAPESMPDSLMHLVSQHNEPCSVELSSDEPPMVRRRVTALQLLFRLATPRRALPRVRYAGEILTICTSMTRSVPTNLRYTAHSRSPLFLESEDC
jgi:hypothetical protein